MHLKNSETQKADGRETANGVTLTSTLEEDLSALSFLLVTCGSEERGSKWTYAGLTQTRASSEGSLGNSRKRPEVVLKISRNYRFSTPFLGGKTPFLLSQQNLTLEVEILVLYYAFARVASHPTAPSLQSPACQFPMSHSDDNYSY